MKKIYPLILLYLFSFSACDDGFEELNRNPLAPTEVAYEAIFNELVSSLRLGWNRQLFLHNEILYDVTELGVVTASTFGNIDGGVQDVWSNYYNALKNARQLDALLDELTLLDPEAASIVKAQSRILMAYKTFQMLDLFGDIPYFDAGKAYAAEEVLRPVYDDARTIYLSLLNDLRSSSDFLITAPGNTALGNPFLRVSASHDALFGDNLTQWINFSNSMLLKYLVRIYDKEPALVEEEVANLFSNGYTFITEGNDVVMLPSEQGWSNLGVNWSFREHNRLRLGTTMWNFLTENDEIIDPRLEIFFETNNNDEWVPFPQVSDSNTPQSGGAPYFQETRDRAYDNKGAENIYSSFNFYLVRDEQDIPEILMTAAEVKFLTAEVFLRGIGVVKDESLASFRYQEGMLASLNFWQDIVENSMIWVNRPPIYSSAELFMVTEHPKYKLEFGGDLNGNLNKIYAQRWVDAFRQPWEAFSLLRRTNSLPREKPENEFFRFQYPVSEQSFNFENWSAQVTKMGGDQPNVKLWWMN
jgi:hypothetical protein